MAVLIQKNVKLLGYGKLLLFFMGCLLFSVSGRIGETLTLEQHMVSVVSDHYYLTYFFIPIMLFFYLCFIEDDSEIVLVRYKTYFSYFCKKWVSSGIIALLIISIQTVCIVLSSLGLAAGNVWTVAENSPNTELFTVLNNFFEHPFPAFVAYTVFQFVGMWFLIGLCMWVIHFTGKKWAIRIIISVYILSAFWIKISALHFLPLTLINHFMILHHNLESLERIVITVITALVMFAVFLYTVRCHWRFHLHFSLQKRGGMVTYYNRWLISKKNIVILTAVTVGILLYKGFNTTGISSSDEWIYYLFSGHGTGYFHILSFLEMIIVNGTPMYLLALFVEKTVSGQSIFASIRSAGRKKLTAAIIRSGLIFLLFYCVIWFIAGIAGIYLLKYGFQEKTFFRLFCMIAFKFLDLSIQYMLMFAIYICTRQITIGFLVLVAVNAVCIAPINVISYLPFGLSSASRISLYGESTGTPVSAAATILSLFFIVFFLWHMKFGYRKLLS